MLRESKPSYRLSGDLSPDLAADEAARRRRAAVFMPPLAPAQNGEA
jgi:hypothetical protein